MMLGFVVRRCTVELGRLPTAAEFAAWANGGGGRGANLFGRPISEAEARVVLRHQARLVTARDAAPEERYVDPDEAGGPLPNVVRLADVRARRSLSRVR
jgi:hypothetical protein